MTVTRQEQVKTAGYTSNNSVELIRGGAPFFTLLEKLIDGARESIHLQIYIYEDDETGTRIAQALIRAAQRGVKIYMLLDGYASRPLSDSSTLKEIRDAGIHFRWFEPLFRGHNFFVGRRMHHKVVVVDKTQGLVGGLNISNRYNDIDGQPAWLDWAAHTQGECVTDLFNRCIQMWFKRSQIAKNYAVRTPYTSSSDCFVRMRVNDWARNKNQISRSYIEMMQRATATITIMSSYFMPGRVLRRNMRLASKRGVKIRIIMTGVSDIPLAKAAERFFYPWLLRRNIEIYEYQRKVLHGKMATYDGYWVTVGSYNVNDLSAYASIELNLDIHDQGFSKKVDATLDEIIKQDCTRITEETLSRSTHIWNTAFYRIAYSVVRLSLFVFTLRFGQEKGK